MKILLLLLLLVSTTVYSQHGSGGAGALGMLIFMPILFLILYLLGFTLYLNISTFFRVTKKKSITGLIVSLVLLVAQIYFLDVDKSTFGSYFPLRIGFTIFSVFHFGIRLIQERQSAST